jgi:phosphopantothenoylcysteine decarboxylase/phosphopantothenate--cysteine ligase
MKILITSGGTDVPIDDVRKISNFSSGRYAANLAREFLKFKQTQVYFLMAKGSMHPLEIVPKGYYNFDFHGLYENIYKDYFDYKEKVVELTKAIQPDIVISAAAVSDYIVDKTAGKISSDEEEITLVLKKAPEILPLISEVLPNTSTLVGFKLMVSPTWEEKEKAILKVLNTADMVVYNDLTKLREGNASRHTYYSDFYSGNLTSREKETALALAESIVSFHEALHF